MSEPQPSPFVEINRRDWAELGKNTELPLTAQEIENIRGLGDFLDLKEVEEVFLPLSRLLNIYVNQTQQLHKQEAEFLGERSKRVPYIIGVAGSVAVGKSTVSRLLKELLERWDGTPKVALVTTDGFLYPNEELEKRGLMTRKGFPESYDRLALLNFVSAIKSGKKHIEAPVYSHLVYDIVPDQKITIDEPDVVIIEGLNVLQPPSLGQEVALSDFFDFKIYVDAKTEDITEWFLNRFQKLRESAFKDPQSYFHRYATMPFEEALATAVRIWETINLPNLRENIETTRSRATLILNKGPSHQVETVFLRRS